MKNLGAVVLFSLAACGGSPPPATAPPPAPVGNVAPAAEPTEPPPVAKRRMPQCKDAVDTAGCGMEALVYFKDEMCDCAAAKDKACAERVTDEMTVWAQEAAKITVPAREVTDADGKLMEEVGKLLGECTTKALMIEDDQP